jgi:ethanolamine kinase
MAPSDYIAAHLNGNKDDDQYRVLVDERPYLPFLVVDPCNEHSICLAASVIVDGSTHVPSNLKVDKISGGITNQLYRVSGLSTTVLVRIFGAEGMIDRNIENATFAALARNQLAPKYHGRFANGRIEQWLEESRPLETKDLSLYTKPIARQLGHLHSTFQVPPHLQEYHNPSKPALWTQIHAWMQQALEATFPCQDDSERVQALHLNQVKTEIKWLEHTVVPQNAKVAFCHNDLLAANILLLAENNDIHFIDFEYGGVNFCAFDIANHFNEYAGGTDTGVPNYDWFPTQNDQEDFITEYLTTCNKSECEMSVPEMLTLVQAFVMVNHLYWALWAVNQASTEGCSGFDYLLYASHRIAEYYKCKSQRDSEQSLLL